MEKFQKLFLLSIVLSLALLLGACGSAVASSDNEPAMEHKMEDMEAEGKDGAMEGMMNDDIPADLDISTTRMTEQGVYHVSVISDLDPAALNQIHSWTLHVETPDGEPIENAEITLDGGMPQHDHGFPTTPKVTKSLGNGDYLIEGSGSIWPAGGK